MAKLLCTFVPQVWQRDYAVTVHFEDAPNIWFVECDDDDLPEPDSYDTDYLREVPQAPDWVRTWPGPFEVHYEVVNERD